MGRLERFTTAQNASDAGFESALTEIRRGRKEGHWIWYVFPQLSGLGSSGYSRLFAIDGEDEAIEFLRDAELRSRLLTIATAVADQLRDGASLRALMGSDVDARKLVSSLTLFGEVARRLTQVESDAGTGSIADVAAEVLAVAGAQGYPACAYTLRALRDPRRRGPTSGNR
jgi:uncharacterized protein (DUF1810 family)